MRAGGHDVPLEKILARYLNTLDNLGRAIVRLPRVTLYDNSWDAEPYRFVAQFRSGKVHFMGQPKSARLIGRGGSSRDAKVVSFHIPTLCRGTAGAFHGFGIGLATRRAGSRRSRRAAAACHVISQIGHWIREMAVVSSAAMMSNWRVAFDRTP